MFDHKMGFDLATGTVIDDRYRVCGVLGEGGMARVYEAEDLQFGRRVAVKVAKGRRADGRAERLFREALAAARTSHAVVITIFEFGTDFDLAIDYLVMERLQGETLRARLDRSGPLSASLTMRVGADLADALAATHRAAIIHRDIKPGNVFLVRSERRPDDVKLLDFGIAKHLDLQSITEPDQLLGTVPYMAPEQLERPGYADARTDIYALGVTLFECLTARPPFEADTVGRAVALVRNGVRPSLQGLRPELPAALVETVERCMSARADDRHATAHELRDALQRLGELVA